ncbi:MAG TPA: DUF308 domain-containing protein [Gammaproteobacteria bacterium]|nr:DUF308 domain-containing protein [Gammaproteobacteria bacterium]
MDTMLSSELRRSWWVLVVWGLVAILFGLAMLLWPGITGIGLVLAFGVMSLAEGLIAVLAMFREETLAPKPWILAYAIASILFALCALFQPLIAAQILLFLLAAWLIIAGVLRVVFAVMARRVIVGEWFIAISGLLAIILGVLFVVFPMTGLITVALWIAAAAIAYGILQIIAGVRLRRLPDW